MRHFPKALDLVNNTSAKAKPLLSSLTLWTAVLLWIQAVLPNVQIIVERGTAFTIVDALILVQITVNLIASIIARYNASSILWTPKGLPGRNRDEAEQLTELPTLPLPDQMP